MWSVRGNSIAKLGSDDRLSGHLHEVNDVFVMRDNILSTSDDASVLIWPI